MVRLVLSCKTLDFDALKRALQLDDDSTLEEISGVFPVGTFNQEAEPCPEPTQES